MGVDRDVSTAYCWSSSGDDVDWLWLIISSTMAVCDWCFSILPVVVNDWRISWSSLFWLEAVPSRVRCGTDRLLWCLIVGIHPSGISIPLSLLILLGWSLMWMASLSLRARHCGSRSLILIYFLVVPQVISSTWSLPQLVWSHESYSSYYWTGLVLPHQTDLKNYRKLITIQLKTCIEP